MFWSLNRRCIASVVQTNREMCFAPNVQGINLICMFKFEERFEFELAKVLDNPERRKVFSGKVKEQAV